MASANEHLIHQATNQPQDSSMGQLSILCLPDKLH